MRLTKIENKKKWDKILTVFKSGKQTVMEISKKFNTDSSTIYKFLRDKKIALPRRKSNYEKMKGNVFGRLLVLKTKTDKDDSYRGLAFCRCLNCNRVKWIRCHSLLDKTTRSCGCLSATFQSEQRAGSNHHAFNGVGEISGTFWSKIVRHAKSRDLKIKVGLKQIWKKFLQQNKKCAISGLPIYFPRINAELGTASLDRIDSSKGYTKENIQWVHKRINVMKNNFSQKHFIDCCSKIYLHHKTGELFDESPVGLKSTRKLGQWTGYEDISGAYWYNVGWGAKARGFKIKMSVKQAWSLFKKQNGYCALSGRKIFLGSKGKTASLDRIDSLKDYTIKNVQWVHKDINKIKMGFPEKELMEFCEKIYYYNLRGQDVRS